MEPDAIDWECLEKEGGGEGTEEKNSNAFYRDGIVIVSHFCFPSYSLWQSEGSRSQLWNNKDIEKFLKTWPKVAAFEIFDTRARFRGKRRLLWFTSSETCL